MKMKSLIMLFLILFLSGCEYAEMNDFNYAIAWGIDKEGDDYLVTVQLLNSIELTNEGISNVSPFQIFSEKGETVFEAMRNLSLQIPNKIESSHTQVLIIGEKCAKEGIRELLDLFVRSYEFRIPLKMLIGRDYSAKEILSIIQSSKESTGTSIANSLTSTNKDVGNIVDINFLKFSNSVVAKGIEPVINGISIIGDISNGTNTEVRSWSIKPTRLYLDNIGVLKGDKLILVGWLSKEEGKGYNYITGNIESSVENIEMNDEKIALEVRKANSNIKVDIVNGEPKIKIEISASGVVAENHADIDLRSNNTYHILEEELRKKLKVTIEDSIEKAKEYGSDIFGFGEAVNQKFPKYFKRHSEDWNEVFKHINVFVKVETKITAPGFSFR